MPPLNPLGQQIIPQMPLLIMPKLLKLKSKKVIRPIFARKPRYFTDLYRLTRNNTAKNINPKKEKPITYDSKVVAVKEIKPSPPPVKNVPTKITPMKVQYMVNKTWKALRNCIFS